MTTGAYSTSQMYSSSRTTGKSQLSQSALSYLQGLEQSTKKLRSGINEKPKPPAGFSSRRGSLSSMISQMRSGKSVDSDEDEDVFNESFGKLSSILDESSDSSGREKVLLDLNLDPIVTKPSPIRALPGLAQVGRSSISELRELRNSIDQSLQQPIQQNLKDSARGTSKTAARRSIFKKQESDELSEVEEEVETDKDSSKKTAPKKSPFKNVVESGSSDAESIDFEVAAEPVERLRDRKVSFRTPTPSESSFNDSENNSSRSDVSSSGSASSSSNTKVSSRSSSSSGSSTVNHESSDQEESSAYEDDFEEQEERPSPQLTVQSRRPSRFTVEHVEDALSPKRTRGETMMLSNSKKSLESGSLEQVVERQPLVLDQIRPEESLIERQLRSSGYSDSLTMRDTRITEQPVSSLSLSQRDSTLWSTTGGTGAEQLPVPRDTTLRTATGSGQTVPPRETGPSGTLSHSLSSSNWTTETRPPVPTLSQSSVSLEDRFQDLMRDFLFKNQLSLQPQLNSSGSQHVQGQDSGTQTELQNPISPLQDALLVSSGVQGTLRTVLETHVRMVEEMNRLEWDTLRNWQRELTLLKEHCDSPSMGRLNRLIEDRVRRE